MFMQNVCGAFYKQCFVTVLPNYADTLKFEKLQSCLCLWRNKFLIEGHGSERVKDIRKLIICKMLLPDNSDVAILILQLLVATPTFLTGSSEK